jgi:hypothetical protein
MGGTAGPAGQHVTRALKRNSPWCQKWPSVSFEFSLEDQRSALWWRLAVAAFLAVGQPAFGLLWFIVMGDWCGGLERSNMQLA